MNHFLNLAIKNNHDSFKGPILEREKSNYVQLKDCIDKFRNEISNRNKENI